MSNNQLMPQTLPPAQLGNMLVSGPSVDPNITARKAIDAKMFPPGVQTSQGYLAKGYINSDNLKQLVDAMNVPYVHKSSGVNARTGSHSASEYYTINRPDGDKTIRFSDHDYSTGNAADIRYGQHAGEAQAQIQRALGMQIHPQALADEASEKARRSLASYDKSASQNIPKDILAKSLPTEYAKLQSGPQTSEFRRPAWSNLSDMHRAKLASLISTKSMSDAHKDIMNGSPNG